MAPDTAADPALAWYNSFQAEITERQEKTGTDPSEWRASGRSSKAWPNAEDMLWWAANGPEFVQAYLEWRDGLSWVVWTTPAGDPGIELDLRCTFGDTPVRAIIDRVFVNQFGELVVVDIKSGASAPQDQGLQLGFYASALEQVFGVRPVACYYWNARKGGVSEPVNVDHLTPQFIGKILTLFTQARDAGLFLPVPSNMCKSCSVRDACALLNGPDAKQYDSLLKEV